jgi:hypothetical protein
MPAKSKGNYWIRSRSIIVVICVRHNFKSWPGDPDQKAQEYVLAGAKTDHVAPRERCNVVE